MAKKKVSNDSSDEEEKIIYALVNTGLILTCSMMSGITKATVNMAGEMNSGIANAIGKKEVADEIKSEIKEKMPEVDVKLKSMYSDMRKNIYSQIDENKKKITDSYSLSDPIFKEGLKIIEKYNFNLPKLTGELEDETLEKYMWLLTSNDANFSEMFKVLVRWMNSLPKDKEEKT